MALFYSGARWQLETRQFSVFRDTISRLLYAPDLSEKTLRPFDVLVVPRESNQEILRLRHDALQKFLGRNGTIVSFGEMTVPWLQDISCVPGRPRFIPDSDSPWDKGRLDPAPMKIIDPDHPVFRSLSVDDLVWHFHGSLVAPAGARVLLAYGDDNCLAIEHRPAGGGLIFASTLDPILHAGYGVVKKTHVFAGAVLNWVKSDESMIGSDS
jgi:hypothetical protein